MNYLIKALLLATIAILTCIAFIPEPLPADDGSFTYAVSGVSRDMNPDVSATDLEEVVRGNNDFAFDLYRMVGRESANTIFSPYSVSIAVAMTYAGARGNTAVEMADTMHYTLPEERLHPALNALDLEIESHADQVLGSGNESPTLHIVNSLWGQEDYHFEQPFLDTIARNYGAGIRLVDFVSNPEQSRVIINDWVAEQTEDKILDLIPEDIIDFMTRLVLVNAIYFKATWQNEFEVENTEDGDFHIPDGRTVTVPMMKQTESFAYTEGDGWQAIQLMYDGGTASMIIILPEEGRFREIESKQDWETVQNIIESLDYRQVNLQMPRFKFESGFSLNDMLEELGMVDAFDMNTANFEGIDGRPDWLYIKAAIHKAYVSVDEEGTEAAAATAVMMAGRGGPPMEEPVDFIADRPFIYLIRDVPTDTILFLGRVMNPAE
jgi:serpin B